MARVKRLRVGVLFGGRSVEHEVSVVSAQGVMAAFDQVLSGGAHSFVDPEI